MNVFKIIPTKDNTTGCALVAADDIEDAKETYINSAKYRSKIYLDNNCIIDIIACLNCTCKNSTVLFDCINNNHIIKV